jgi:hypothetical protein
VLPGPRNWRPDHIEAGRASLASGLGSGCGSNGCPAPSVRSSRPLAERGGGWFGYVFSLHHSTAAREPQDRDPSPSGTEGVEGEGGRQEQGDGRSRPEKAGAETDGNPCGAWVAGPGCLQRMAEARRWLSDATSLPGQGTGRKDLFPQAGSALPPGPLKPGLS